MRGRLTALVLLVLVAGSVGGSSVLAAEPADLVVSIADTPDPVVVGTNLTYTVTVTNSGADPFEAVTLTDVLPAGVTPVSATSSVGPACTNAATVVCPLGTLAPQAQATVTIVVTPQQTGPLANTVSVASPTPAPGGTNNQATANTMVRPVTANLVLTLTDSPEPVKVGSLLTYTLNVTNRGPDAASALTLTDTLPASVTPVSATSNSFSCTNGATVTCTLATLASDTNATATIVVRPQQTGPLTNSANVSAQTFDPAMGNNSDSTQTNVIALSANLAISITDAPDPVTAGHSLVYTINIVNNGPDTASAVEVRDVLPASVTPLSASTTVGSCVINNTVVCALGALQPAATATVTIIVAPQQAGLLANGATVSSPTIDPASANNSASTQTNVLSPPPPTPNPADVTLTKAASPEPVALGGTLTYTLVVANNGPGPAANVRVVDTLPVEVQFVSASGVICSGTLAVTCTLGTLSSGAQRTITIVVTAKKAGTIVNTAIAQSDSSDPNPQNNVASRLSTVGSPAPPGGPAADLAVSKADAVDPLAAGSDQSYTISVVNNGPDVATDVRLTDSLPAGAVLVSASAGQATCSGGPEVVCAVGSLPPTGTAVVQLVVRLPTPGKTVNSARATSAVADPVAANDTASVETTVGLAAPPMDLKAPGEVSRVAIKVASRTLRLSWLLPQDPDLARVVVLRSSKKTRPTVVHQGRSTSFTDRRLKNGVRYRYTLRTADAAGNMSAGRGVSAVPQALALLAPPDAARVKTPPLLRWRKVDRATYYNVQLFRGTAKVRSIWPRTTSLRLVKRWKYRGRSYSLTGGLYRWYVWPGFGLRSAARYGPLLGQSTFRVVGT